MAKSKRDDRLHDELHRNLDALKLTGTTFEHTGDLLTASYTGDVSLAGEGALKGKLNASSDKLRDLLAAADNALFIRTDKALYRISQS